MNIATMHSIPAHSSSARRLAGWLAAALGVLLLVAATAGRAALRAELDRRSAHEGETVTLTLAADGVQITGEPDLAPLQKDFRVLGTSVSRQMNLINGHSSSQTQWLIQLQPRHVGKLIVPALSLGGEQSAPLELDVTDSSPPAATLQTGQHLFLEAETPGEGKSLEVGQQIPYTLRFYYDDTLREGGLDAPQADDAMIEQLGQEKRYTTFRNGRQLHVIERRYAITPEKSGRLRVPPVTFHGLVAGAPNAGFGSSRLNGLMEEFLRNSPFANDPMFKNSFAGFSGIADPGRPVTVQSQAVTLDIAPRPAAAGNQWLPAEELTLTDSWSEHPPQFSVGEPVTRTITVEARGLTGAQIPEIAVATPANARVYHEASVNESRSDGEAIHGVSKQTLTYIPATAGTLTIPPVGIDWWNTRSNSQSRASLPERKFEVKPGVAGSQNAAAAPAGPGAAAAQPSAPANQPPAPATATLSLARRLQMDWPYLGAAGALLLAVAAGIWMLRRRSHRQTPATASAPASASASSPTPAPTPDAALRALRQACTANDARAAATALLALGRARWPLNPPHSLGAFAARLARGADETRALDRSLYAPDASPCDGAALWAAFSDGVQEKNAESRPMSDGLDPLYQ